MATSITNAEAMQIGRYRVSTTAISMIGIWLSAVLIALFSPDMVTGSEQEHIPIATFTIWFHAGLPAACVMIAAAVRRRARDTAPANAIHGLLIALIWISVAVASIFGPVMETGTDPTTIPVSVLVAPIVAFISTAFISIFVAGGGVEE